MEGVCVPVLSSSFLVLSSSFFVLRSCASVLTTMEPEDRHRRCWYSRRTLEIPLDIGAHTIEDGLLLYCAHPMLYPIVGLSFDVRNCTDCEYFRERRAGTEPRIEPP